jgi:membrane protease YdiL (CAAX protease family)
MTKFQRFSGSHPILFSLILIVVWFLVGALATGAAAVALQIPFTDSGPQSIGTLSGTLAILLITWRFGWLKSSGIGSIGNIKVWLMALLMFSYLIAAYSFAFYGDLAFDFSNLFSSETARSILSRQIVVGTVEEILFRGVVLFALVRVWGNTKRGLFFAVLLSAFLFGIIHLLQVFAGKPLGDALMTVLEGTVSGLWWGACVILWGTIWPAVLLHAGSNAFVMIKGLNHPGLAFSYPEYFLAILFQIPLVILVLYWLLKTAPRPVIPDIP